MVCEEEGDCSQTTTESKLATSCVHYPLTLVGETIHSTQHVHTHPLAFFWFQLIANAFIHTMWREGYRTKQGTCTHSKQTPPWIARQNSSWLLNPTKHHVWLRTP
eukprot:TRINITY_DN67996_c7_g3_i1.p2 TRINITY_DN67996_c7_g3~~TRINITY_DN67996_c7_g3_i1.p2  ORF type:complete len:105 (-),score=4.71 TRINITY_DN67996_c7_g3_i1:107-421(-)